MRNLLIVEDETLIRLGMKVMLDWTELGVKLIGEAANGQEAMEWVESCHIDIIITDIRMPIMDGIQLIRLCKERYPNIGFIILSSYDDFQYAKEAIQLGVSDYILKPTMSIAEIKASIDKIMKSIPVGDSIQLSDNHGISQMQQELLKEHVIDNALMQDTWDLREEEESLFGFPFWVDTTRAAVIALKETNTLTIINNSSSVKTLFTLAKDHKGTDKMEVVAFRGGLILIFMQQGYSEDTSFSVLREELAWNIKQSLGMELYWDEQQNLKNWKQTRRAINEMILNLKLVHNDGISEMVQKSLEFMATHFQDAIGLKQVADLVGVTPSYFSRLFKQNTGESFIRHMSNLRFDLAKELLLNGNKTAAAVGKAVGYPNPRYFTKWFKVMTGMTPSEYRRLKE
ncbi:response regulator [Paenibacillus psychroresistens]|uniref:Response regulator n=1 Tax=Paenibacillus psychroresistens TaxID=1778678 RepID=A0A6B8RHV9_9BACL|nr:response regulator [Paenibacillus psychroresistens]QGQ95123.1 response regulator [Paenibacillus psychroresistens]